MEAAEAGRRRWLMVRVKSPSEESTAWLAEGLVSFGASAVQEDADGLVTWFPPPADRDAFLARLVSELEAWTGGPAVVLDCEWRLDEDWARTWRAGLGPRRIGRIVVTPTWCAPDVPAGDIVVTIDPQMAFGTGEHASTRGVLRLLQKLAHPGDRVLDVGTGSGVLAIAAARLGARRVIAVDNDADALINARENVDRNGCADRVTIEHGTVDAAWLRVRAATWDLVLANVLSGVLIPLLPAFRAVVRERGHVILAGILTGEAEALRAAAQQAGFHVATEDTEGEWWGVTLAP